MGRKRLAAAAVPLAALALAAPADAQEPRLPKDAPVVATTPAGARMFAFDYKRKLCTAFLAPRERRVFAYPSCERPSHDLRQLDLGETSYPQRSFHHGIVEPEVASVELVFGRGRTARADTSDGAAYTGRYAGKVRFVIVEERGRLGGPDPAYVRLFDAAGVLLALADTYTIGERPVARPRELARGRAAGTPWAFRALRMRVLASVPGDEERFVRLSCVDVRRRGRISARGLSIPTRNHARACLSREGRSRSAYAFDQDCALGGIVTGIVPPRTRAVVAVLGDGRSRRVPLRRLPAIQPRGRAFALVLGPRVALRRLLVLGRDGGREVVTGGMGPGSIRCGLDGVIVAFSRGDEPEAARGPLGLTVYDDGVQLCATLARPTDHPDECRYPPVAPDDAWVLSRTSDGRRLVAAIVPAGVVRATVELRDGRRMRLDTTAIPGYGGRWAGALRVFTLELTRRASIEEIYLFDARGRRTRAYYFDDPPPFGPRRLVIGGSPGLRLRGQWHGSPREPFGSYLCMTLGPGECSFGSALVSSVRADCAPRRLVVWGLVPRAVRDLAVDTDQGEIPAHVEPLPRPLRPRLPRRPGYLRRYQAVAAFIVVIPPGARPRAIVVAAGRTARVPLRLPSAAEQCGYDDFVFLT
jgi:hypothetical protein